MSTAKRQPLFKGYPPELTDICITGEIAVLTIMNREYAGPLGHVAKAATIATAVIATHSQLNTALSQRLTGATPQ